MPAYTFFYLLLEDGNYLLLEDGGRIIIGQKLIGPPGDVIIFSEHILDVSLSKESISNVTKQVTKIDDTSLSNEDISDISTQKIEKGRVSVSSGNISNVSIGDEANV